MSNDSVLIIEDSFDTADGFGSELGLLARDDVGVPFGKSMSPFVSELVKVACSDPEPLLIVGSAWSGWFAERIGQESKRSLGTIQVESASKFGAYTYMAFPIVVVYLIGGLP